MASKVFWIIAHRGARSLAPENTIAAGRKALEKGADLWEVDVRMSRDGQLVIVHDPTLERTSDVKAAFPSRHPWYVHDFTIEEIRSLDAGSWFNRDDPFNQIAKGRVSRGERDGFSGETIPTLEEALYFTLEKDWCINIEIKDLTGLPGHNNIVTEIVEKLHQFEVVEKVIVSSFNHDYLAQIGRLEKRIRTGVLVSRAHPDPLKLLTELNASIYQPRSSCVRPWQLRKIRDHGFGILVWVVNRKAIAYSLKFAGVHGIFTDYPQTMAGLKEPGGRMLLEDFCG